MSDPVAEPEKSAPTRAVVLRRLGISLLPLILFVWVLHAGALPLIPPKGALAHAHWGYLGLYCAIWLVSVFVRAARWTWLLRPIARIPMGAVVRVSLMGSAALLLLPMRTGEVVRPLALRKYNVSALSVAGTIGVERIIDGLMVTGLLFVSLLFGSPGSVGGLDATDQGIDPAIATTAAHLALAVFSAAFAALALLFWQRERVTRILALLTGRKFPRLQRHLISFLDRLTQGFECLRDVSGASKYLVVTAIYWSLYALSIWSIIRCAGIGTIGIIEVCAVTGLLSLGFTLPAPPGFFGAYQAAFYAGLLLYLPSAQVTTNGSVAVFLSYAVQMILTLSLGASSLWLERRRAAPPISEPGERRPLAPSPSDG